MFIPVLLGTAREGNQSSKVANYVVEQIKKLRHESEVVSTKDHVTNPFTERIGKEKKGGEAYKNLITKADALVIVTPEYNHSFPGEIKLMIDQLYEEYSGMPVAICGVSGGPWGGARAVESLLPVMVGVEMLPIKKNVNFSGVSKLFDDKGKITDNAFDERVAEMVKALAEYARKLSFSGHSPET